MRLVCCVLFTILLTAAGCAAEASSLPPEEAEAVAPAAGDSQPEEAAAPAQSASAADNLKKILGNLRAKADKGDLEAQDTLGRMYYDGLVVPRNYSTAAQWYARAAMQGNSNSQGMLSRLYMEGTGVPQNYAKAYFWFMLSLDPRDEEWKDKHDEIAQYLNADQIAEQDKILSEWKPSSIKHPEENAEAQAAGAECPALEIFKAIPYPKTESTRCKENYKKAGDICHESCGSCEAAMDKFRDVCAGIMTAQEAAGSYSFCVQDSDCVLIETDCRKDYNPLAVNVRVVQAVRRSRGYPEEDCRRSAEDKEKQNGYSTACTNKSCEMKLP